MRWVLFARTNRIYPLTIRMVGSLRFRKAFPIGCQPLPGIRNSQKKKWPE